MKEIIAEYGMIIAFIAIAITVLTGFSGLVDYISAFPF